MGYQDSCMKLGSTDPTTSIPHLFVSTVSIFYVPYLYIRKPVSRNPFYKWIFILRTVFCILIMLTELTRFILGLYRLRNLEDCLIVYTLTSTGILLSTILIATIGALEFSKGVFQSPVLMITTLLLLASKLQLIRLYVYQDKTQGGNTQAINGIDYIYIPIVATSLFITIMADILLPSRCSKRKSSSERVKKICPATGTNILVRTFFTWMLPQMLLARKRTLTTEDLFEYSFKDSCKGTLQSLKLALSWKSKGIPPRVYQNKKRRTFLIAVLKLIALPILPSFIASVIACFLNVTIIFNIRALIRYVDSEDKDDTKGIYLCFVLLLQGLLFSMCTVPWYYTSHYAAARIRSLAGALIIDKFFVLAPASRHSCDMNVLSLLTLDVHKISLIFSECNVFHLPIFYCPLAIVVMWQALGPSCIVGVVVIILIFYLNSIYLRQRIQNIKAEEIEVKTKRVKLLSSALSGIKVMKSYAWEVPFMERILKLRKRELNLLRKVWLIRILALTLSSISPALITTSMLLIYFISTSEHSITSDRIFIVLAVVSRFRFYVGFLPMVASIFSQGLVSLKRFYNFIDLEEENRESDERKVNSATDTINENTAHVMIRDASFSWTNDSLELKRINLTVGAGELIGIVGVVGCGKSTLLSAILGEVNLKGGTIHYVGRVGYVPQESWMMNGTIRENILFGQGMNSAKYKTVLKACALTPDLQDLPLGDGTQIGERGVTLSGGQRQRISLARAVYSDADVYLLDDPLSSVDRAVASHIFNQVIGPRGILAGKTRVFVTHTLEYLPSVDRTICIQDGQIMEGNSCTHLQGQYFAIKDSRKLLVGDYSNDMEAIDRNYLASDTLMTDESIISRTASWRTAQDYVKEFGWKLSLGLLVGLAIIVFIMVRINLWVSAWSDDWKKDATMATRGTPYRLGVFATLGLAKGVSVMFTLVMILLGTLSAATSLHWSLLSHVFSAKTSFFDTTPFGRILNWFTRDLDDIDENLPNHLWSTLDQLSDVLVLMVMVFWISPWFLLASLPFLGIIILIQRLYSIYARDGMRLETANRSPVFSFFKEVQQGVVSIRASKREKHFSDKFFQLLDKSTAPSWHVAAAKGFMISTTMVIASLVNFCVCLGAVLLRHELDPSFLAAAIYVAFTYLLVNHKLIHAIAELERSMISVERVTNSKHIPREASGDQIAQESDPCWPRAGKIEFVNYRARYRPNLVRALTNINLSIEPGMKVGIVGRTGAGKTTLTYALLGMLEKTEGQLKIDNIDISTVELCYLRSKITVISQEPVIFETSIRDNLDPSGGLLDGDIWEALDRAHLREHISTFKDGINTCCDNLGDKFSVGQRQLFCLARALLRRSRILVLDEPTASVDDATDQLVRKTLREHFNDCTLLTISHRLNTILDYDMIIVMHQGEVLEFDTPGALMRNPDSYLYRFAKEK